MVLLTLAGVRPVAAQTVNGTGAGAAAVRGMIVRGTVVLADGIAPAAGVIVLLESGPGVVAARALTDERGGFVATLPTVGRYRLRALRIGYQPTVVDVVVEETTTLRVVLIAPAVVLPSVAVRGEDVCRGGATDGAVVAQVWEEARKALLASGLSASAPLFAEWIEYERTLDTTSRIVRDQRVRSTRMATTHAFRSLPAARLAEHGYVVDTDDGTMFHAPDADVLLSESFAAMHCFHLEPPTRERPTMIGVGFRPVRDRRQVSDIYGTFWIDRESRELKALEYRYTNLPSVTERVRPGGVVEFMRLESGSWLVQRWSIRMPQLVTLVPQTIRRRGVSVTGTPITVTAVRIVGGEVSRVDRANTLLYQADGAALAAQVTPSDSLTSLADIRITLDGTDYALLTDSRGRGRLPSVLPGAYQLRALTPLMDSLGLHPEPMDVSIRPDDGRPVAVPIPSQSSLLRRLCGEPRAGIEGGHARGVVVDDSGLPVADAVVQLTWQQQIGVVSDRLMWHERSASTRTDSVGTWHVCDVPRDQGMLVRVRSDSLAGVGSVRVPHGALFASSHVALRRAAVNERPSMIGTLVLDVTDSASRPVADAQVVVTMAGRQRHRARTDATGRVIVPPLPVGSLTVEVRKVGFASGTVAAEIEAGENTVPIVMHSVGVPQLAAIRVIGNRTINARHAEFERRHAAGDATASITADEIERRNPVSTWQMLSRVPSLMVLDSAGSIYARSSRMSSIVCWPRVAIDGQVLSGIPNLAQLPNPRDIFGIEVFAGSASTPLRYGGEGEGRYCGLIAIWTK
jgi:Carboxypeptidase regulatory-like domain